MEKIGQVQGVLKVAWVGTHVDLVNKGLEFAPDWVLLSSPFDVVGEGSLLELVVEMEKAVGPFFQSAPEVMVAEGNQESMHVLGKLCRGGLKCTQHLILLLEVVLYLLFFRGKVGGQVGGADSYKEVQGFW